jgi:hypothetical protein
VSVIDDGSPTSDTNDDSPNLHASEFNNGIPFGNHMSDFCIVVSW